MATRVMRSRGDLNAFLNGLVREGVIKGFATTNPRASVVLDLTIQVDAAAVDETLERVRSGLTGKFADLPVSAARG